MKKIALFLTCQVLAAIAFANNLQITNLSTTGNNTVAKTVLIKFDISWDNSWRTTVAPTNYDAAWVFIKYKNPVSLEWDHATISISAADHVAATGSTIKPAPEGTGAMIYRSVEGNGTVNYTNNQLLWKYGVDGLNSPVTDITVMGIEMVYVQEGAYYLGDGIGANSSKFSFYTGTEPNKAPVQINTSLSLPIMDPSSQRLFRINGSAGVDFNNDGVIDNPNFPTGYKAGYCMKYEISRGQYGAFLQLLTSGQRGSRLGNNAIPYFTNTYAAIIPDRAMGEFNWDDLTAYCDWSGLRPMTELEYEKVSRGFGFPSLKDLPFGALNDAVISTGLVNPGTPNEASSGPAGANMYINQNIFSAARVGLFATANSTRLSSGASYFGIMNLADNVDEFVITAYNNPALPGTSNSINFAGNNGDGKLSVAGFANQISWPSAATEIFIYTRGGRYNANATTLSDGLCSISSRHGGTNAVNDRFPYTGGRAFRGDW